MMFKIKRVSVFTAALVMASLVTGFSGIKKAESKTLKAGILKYSTFGPPSHHTSINALDPFVEAVEKRTGGRFKVLVYYSGALGAARDHWDVIRGGIVDMGSFCVAYTPELFRLSEITSLPFISPDATTGTKIINELYDKGLLDEAYSQVKVLGLINSSPGLISTSTKKITRLEDFKGLKIRGAGGVRFKAIKALGGIPIGLGSGDQYMALERGLIDGTALSPGSSLGHSLHEVLKYVFEIPMGCGTCAVAMNLHSFNRLPKDIQAILLDLGREMAYETAKSYDNFDKIAKERMSRQGIEFITPTDEEINRWRTTVKPVYDTYIDKLNKDGLPGDKVFEEYIRIWKHHLNSNN